LQPVDAVRASPNLGLYWQGTPKAVRIGPAPGPNRNAGIVGLLQNEELGILSNRIKSKSKSTVSLS
jgi:hypothetical protein